MQVTEFNLGIGVTDSSKWKLQYEYGELQANGTVDTTKNTGNIARQTSSFAGLTNPFVQSFKYDSLYRLIEATEKVGTTQTWKQNFGYDRFGNRIAFTNEINGQVQTNNNLTHPTIDANTNRFNTGQGYVFDKNGNLTTDPTNGNRSFTFNGENKQTEVKDASGNPIGKYFYDGEGKRVKKEVYANGQVTEITVFVYSNGKLVAEYSTLPPPQNPTTSYTMTDQLDSPRVITNALGEVTSRRDFKPFGEEIGTDANYRTPARKYGVTDNIRQKFTGYQKDTETQLDFAEARMYQNLHGRFTAVDPLLASGKSANPQTFNRYVYCLNNPLIFTDPTGLQVASWQGPVYQSPDGNTFSKTKQKGFTRYDSDDQIITATDKYQYAISKRGVTNLGKPFEYIPRSDGITFEDFLNEMKENTLNLPGELSKAWTFKNLKEDWNLFSSDPLGPKALGSQGFAFVTGGLSSGLSFGSRTTTTTTTVFTSEAKALQFEQYSLRAAEEGLYPVMKRGFKEPQGEVFLNKGDVWKFGTTKNPTTRYSQTFLRTTGKGLRYFTERQAPTLQEVLIMERFEILNFRTTRGFLPYGNKMVK